MSNRSEHTAIEWPALNRQRGLLIAKHVNGKLSAPEARLLDALQEYASSYVAEKAPRPTLGELDALEERLGLKS